MKKLKAVFFSTIISILITLLLVAIAALIISKVGALPEKSLTVIVTLICCIAVLAGGYLVSLVLKERGILFGGMVALFYAVIILGVSLIMEPRTLELSAMGKICAILISGALGGILAVNRKSKVKF